MLKHMPEELAAMNEARKVRFFRNGRNQAVRIPVEFEMPGNEGLMRKEGDKLVIEPKKTKRSLLDVLEEFGPLTKDEWPDVTDADLLPLDDVKL